MKRHTVILPFVVPRLTDKAAAQFVELLNELISGIEHHYAEQLHRHHKRQREIRQDRQSPPSGLTDPPF
jgi:demethoxyubiquinone hydroxylase (CLK1/Coq7/Cat5 family)